MGVDRRKKVGCWDAGVETGRRVEVRGWDGWDL